MLFEPVKDVSLAQLDFDARVAAGYRAASISVWYDGGLRFAAVWKEQPLGAWQQLFVGNKKTMKAVGPALRPELIAAATLPGPGEPTAFALVTRQDPALASTLTLDMPLRPVARGPGVGLPPPIQDWCSTAIAGKGWPTSQLLLSASLYRTAKGHRVAAVTRNQGGLHPLATVPGLLWGYHVARSLDEVDRSMAAFQQHPALWPTTVQPVPPAQPVSPFDADPPPRFLSVWWEQAIGPWAAFTGLTASELEEESATQAALGRSPIRLFGGKGATGPTRYGVVFAQDDVLLPRKFKARRVAPPPSAKPAWQNQPPSFIQPLEANVLQNMQRFNIRTAHIAIARKGRLIYAAGFTYAEPGYPAATPTTRTRVASITKVFTKIAIFQGFAYAQAPGLGLDSLVYPLLQMRDQSSACRSKTLTGEEPPSTILRELRIGHLLGHEARWNGLPSLSTVRASVQAANAKLAALGGAAPCEPTQAVRPYNREQYERVMLGMTDAQLFEPGYAPGDPLSFGEYGNANYFWAGRVAEVIGRTPAGLPSGKVGTGLETQHFRQSIADALGLPDSTFGIVQMGQPTSGEAFAPCDLLQFLRRSELEEAPTLCLDSYYWNAAETMSGSGNLSMTMAAIMRVMSAFDVAPCPILPEGFHAALWPYLFDDPQNPIQYPDELGALQPVAAHGATMTGGRGGVVRRLDGGFTCSILWNRNNGAPNVLLAYNNLVNASVADGTIPSYDLFPQLGIPSLVP